MKTYKQLRKYVVKHYGETVAEAMDRGKRKGGETPELSDVLMERVDWQQCDPFPGDFWYEMHFHLEKREAKKRRRKAEKPSEACGGMDVYALRDSYKGSPSHKLTTPIRPTGRLGRILELREEIAKRRGEEAARVYDCEFRNFGEEFSNFPLSRIISHSLSWAASNICAHPYQSHQYWRGLQEELKADGL